MPKRSMGERSRSWVGGRMRTPIVKGLVVRGGCVAMMLDDRGAKGIARRAKGRTREVRRRLDK